MTTLGYSGRFKKIGVVGSGSYGTIYHGIDTVTNKRVAIKENSTKHGSNEQLDWEYKIYQQLNGIPIHGSTIHWPNAYTLTTTKDNKKTLVMDLLGPSIDSVFKNNNNILDYQFTANIAKQSINLLKTLHNRGILHRDLKPQNFVFQADPIPNVTSPHLFLIDLGLARVFATGNKHDHYQTARGLRGTLRYMSIWSHLGVKQSRRDDMQSLGYMLVYLCTGKLPWQKLPRMGNKNEDSAHILRYKMNTTPEELVSDIRSTELKQAIMMYMLVVGSLSYSEKPPYDYLLSLFERV